VGKQKVQIALQQHWRVLGGSCLPNWGGGEKNSAEPPKSLKKEEKHCQVKKGGVRIKSYAIFSTPKAEGGNNSLGEKRLGRKDKKGAVESLREKKNAPNHLERLGTGGHASHQ